MPSGGTEHTELVTTELHAWYGESHVLHGVNLSVSSGEVITLLGRNGAGKTTTLRAIMGLMDQRRGSIQFNGHELIAALPNQIAKLGIAYCPEERGIFSSLSVEENLTLPPQLRPGGMTTRELYDLFPMLLLRRRSQGTKLSGGEQQMLAIARILRTGARFLLLDEPTEGLAPVIVEQISMLLKTLKANGFTMVLVEQNLDIAADIADRHYVIENGQVIDTVSATDSASDVQKLERYLGL